LGQTIQILKTSIVDKVAMFDTDRSLTGQDGHSYATLAEAEEAETFPAQLAARLFAGDSAVDNVYLFSNVISVARLRGWDEEGQAIAEATIRDFFVVYEENKG